NIYKREYSNLANIDEMDLRYDFLEGNAKFSSDTGLINLHDDIPLLDLAVALRLITIKLNGKRDDKQSFDYTESGSEVIFTKAADKLTITTTDSEEIIQTKFKEFA